MTIMQTLKNSDIFLFCHKTPESPRCLVEALVSGCPLVGYGSAFPKDLVAQRGGGQFAAVGDWRELVNIVKKLDKNREKLGELIQSASATGRLYERDATMQHRIDLIKENRIASRGVPDSLSDSPLTDRTRSHLARVNMQSCV